MSNVDRILDVIDGGLQRTTEVDAEWVDATVCWRCEVAPAGKGSSAVCRRCRDVLVGLLPEEPTSTWPTVDLAPLARAIAGTPEGRAAIAGMTAVVERAAGVIDEIRSTRRGRIAWWVALRYLEVRRWALALRRWWR